MISYSFRNYFRPRRFDFILVIFADFAKSLKTSIDFPYFVQPRPRLLSFLSEAKASESDFGISITFGTIGHLDGVDRAGDCLNKHSNAGSVVVGKGAAGAADAQQPPSVAW